VRLDADLVTDELGDTEVEHLGSLAAWNLRVAHDEDVLWLEIAVNDTAEVGGAERARDLAHEPPPIEQGEGSMPLESSVERFALE